jgi:hypothetical protein
MSVLGMRGRPGSAGLPLAYFLGLSLIHVPGAFFCLDSEWSDDLTVWTRTGFEQTIIGMAAFLVGVVIARLPAGFMPRSVQPYAPQTLSCMNLDAVNRLALLYVSVGLIMYFVLNRFISMIPSAGAIAGSLGSLIIIGICLRLWAARESSNTGRFWSTLAFLPMLPLGTTVLGGFLGYGTTWVLTILSFLFSGAKRRAPYLLLAPAVVFLGLSIFVNYWAARNDIRRLVWYQPAGLSERLQRIVVMFDNFEWLDLSSAKHRDAITERMNQNWLVGVAVNRLDSGQVDFASGATLGNMLLGLIPRAIWLDKPAVGGSGSLVHDLTGIEFAEGTSVGVGQVMEFYANFGTWSVIGGFLIYGWLLGRTDLRVIGCLRSGDQKGYVFWFSIAVAMLFPGGSLLETFVGAASGAVTGYLIGCVLDNSRFVTRVIGHSRAKIVGHE